MDWVNGHSKLKMKKSTIASVQNLLRDWWAEVWIYDTEWSIGLFTFFVNITQKPIHGLGKASKVVKKNGWTLRTLFGWGFRDCSL